MHQLVQNNMNKKTLAAWLKGGRFPHAILLDGSVGSGKKTFAKIIANSLICNEKDPPCGNCNHCMKIEKDIHPDFMVYKGEGGARSFHVDTVRQIREQAYISPNEADCKVFLLVDAHEMSVQAQNALLKIIEEPPDRVYFILTCENRNQMLPTIRSRVVSLTMEIPEAELTEKVLKQRVEGKTPEEYRSAAVQAGGNIGLALSFLENDQETQVYNTANTVWQHLKNGRELEAASILAGYHRDRPGFLEQLSLLRSIVLREILDLSTEQHANTLKLLQLHKIIDIIDDVELSANSNINMLLLVSILPFKIRQVVATR